MHLIMEQINVIIKDYIKCQLIQILNFHPVYVIKEVQGQLVKIDIQTGRTKLLDTLLQVLGFVVNGRYAPKLFKQCAFLRPASYANYAASKADTIHGLIGLWLNCQLVKMICPMQN